MLKGLLVLFVFCTFFMFIKVLTEYTDKVENVNKVWFPLCFLVSTCVYLCMAIYIYYATP